jgi:hypothetical protein
LASAALLLAACAPNYPTRLAVAAQDTPAPVVVPPAPTPELPRSPVAPPSAPSLPTPNAPAPRSPIPGPRVSGRDQCGAQALQGLVGRLRTEIPVPLDPTRQRVACVTCPVSGDVDPGRLNFFFDARTGRIRQIRCG